MPFDLLVLAAAQAATPRPAPVFDTNPVLDPAQVTQVSPHCYVLPGFPDVGFVVGERHILVIDTGMGAPSGAKVVEAARHLATKGQTLILTTTHLHPEHASGAQAFPAGTPWIRPRVQQAESDADGDRWIDFFRGRSPQIKQLLADYHPMRADTLFDTHDRVDLGGVTVDLYYFGPAHTRGDEVIFVPGDSVLYPGDIVQDRIVPAVLCDTCTPRTWLSALDRIAALKPRHIVPDHGWRGGPELIAQQRSFLHDLDALASQARHQGVPLETAKTQIGATLHARYPEWINDHNVAGDVAKAYTEAP